MFNGLVVFSHGKESGPMGTKIKAMSDLVSQLGLEWQSIDYRGMDDPELRVEKLTQSIQAIDLPILLVGSSMGAYVSLRASRLLQPQGLFLLAPAVYMPGYDNADIAPNSLKTLVIHGWQDEIVPVEHAVRFGQTYQCELRLVDDDHVLRNSLPSIIAALQSFVQSF